VTGTLPEQRKGGLRMRRKMTCALCCTPLLAAGLFAAGCLMDDQMMQQANDDQTARRTAFVIAPRPSSPRPQQEDVLTSTLLSWTPVPGATKYEIHLGVDTRPPLLVTVFRTNYLVRDLPECTVHYWRIVAMNDEGETISSPTETFTTRCD
jgi:hypothetical protein